MKRLFAFLLCFILALPALTGCGAAQGDAAPQDNVPAEATPAEITPGAAPNANCIGCAGACGGEPRRG